MWCADMVCSSKTTEPLNTVQAAIRLPLGLHLHASCLNWLRLKSPLTSRKIKACHKRPLKKHDRPWLETPQCKCSKTQTVAALKLNVPTCTVPLCHRTLQHNTAEQGWSVVIQDGCRYLQTSSNVRIFPWNVIVFNLIKMQASGFSRKQPGGNPVAAWVVSWELWKKPFWSCCCKRKSKHQNLGLWCGWTEGWQVV